MSFETNVEGRESADWRTCDWQPHPHGEGRTWHPIRRGSRPDEGYYLLRLGPGQALPDYDDDVREEFIVLDGALTDDDGVDLVAGDFVSYPTGMRHRAVSEAGCVMLTCTAHVPGDGWQSRDASESRIVANWKTTDFSPYPGLPKVDNPLLWHNVRGNPDTAEGFYITRFTPGATSAAHEHTGYEEFVILEGCMIDSDGTAYQAGTCVSLPPGSIHDSHSPEGCFVSSMISAPFRNL